MMSFLLKNLYLVKIFAVLLTTLVVSLFERAVFHRAYRRAKSHSLIWNDSLIYAIHFPLKLYIFLSGIVLSITILEKNFAQVETFFSHWIGSFYKVGGALLFIWVLFRFIDQIENRISSIHSIKHNQTTSQGIIRILKIFVFSISGLIVLQWFGIPLSGIIAVGGFGGIAVGFASKDLLANLFGGMMIFFDRQFEIGDWIRSPDREIEGIVEHIGWRLTKVRTLEKRPLFIPNSIFSNITLENPSHMSNRRIKATIGINYKDASKLKSILPEIENLLVTHPEIDTANVCFVNFVNFGPHALEIMIYAFTKTTHIIKFQAVQQEIFLKILEIIQTHEATIAYPATLLNLPIPANQTTNLIEPE